MNTNFDDFLREQIKSSKCRKEYEEYKNGHMNRKICIVEDSDGNKIVLIQDIIFKGKRVIDWHDVEIYLRQYINQFYRIAESGEEIFIGTDLPSEYSGSIYTSKLKGTIAKAKANASQGLPEIIEIATNPKFEANRKKKHRRDARYGWYRYDSKFALPVFDEDGEIIRFNIFNVRLLVRHAGNGKKYLYDIMEIKKETSKCCQE